MLYLDASLVVAALAREARTAEAQAWLAVNDTQALCISAWTATEVASAISLKVRDGRMSARLAKDARLRFKGLQTQNFTNLGIGNEHFVDASCLLENHTTGLRAGDALHLAIASAHGATVCTLDRTMATAGRTLGIETVLV